MVSVGGEETPDGAHAAVPKHKATRATEKQRKRVIMVKNSFR